MKFKNKGFFLIGKITTSPKFINSLRLLSRGNNIHIVCKLTDIVGGFLLNKGVQQCS
jgi:hypothetical protein